MKKLKARPGKLAGTRVVFDEDGTALMPLEALARKQQRESGGGNDTNGAGVEASLVKAEERFRALRAELKARDVEDKALLRQRLRERRLKNKMKLRAAEAGEGGAVELPRLARRGGEEEGDGRSNEEDEGERRSSEEEEGYEQRRGEGGVSEGEGSEEGWRGDGNGAEVPPYESSDEGEDGEEGESEDRAKQRKRRKGWAPDISTKKQRAGAGREGVGPASMAERESLVLKLLAARKGQTS